MTADDDELDQLRLEVAHLRASRTRIALADDAERRCIEEAFHGGVQQRLVGIAANLQLAEASLDADAATTRTLFAEIRRDIARTLEEARSLALRIHPPLLDASGLAPALRMAAANAGIRARIDAPAGATGRPEIARMVYYCCLDVFEQVDAGTMVTVTVRIEEAITFEIVVDGELDAGSLPMRDRVEALGGELSVDPASDDRTRLLGSVMLSG